MGLIVTSVITVGSISPVSAMESQHKFNNNAETKTQHVAMKESITNSCAAAQFTFNEDCDKVLTVTPKANFRSHNRNLHKVECEAPVIDEEITDESMQNRFHLHLFEAYDKLITIYDKLLNSFL